ncbi:trigger factor [bacterium]|nr:trigger factor [bacterium]
MKVRIQKIPKSEVELKITVSPQRFEEVRERSVLELGKEIEIKGFRKGKVPKEIIEKELGQEQILRKTAETIIKESYKRAIRENKITPLGEPDVKILKFAPGNPFEFKIRVAVMPEVKLPNYKEIAQKCKRRKISVSDEEIKNTLTWLQKSRAKYITKTEAAQKGDFIEIEFSSPQIESGTRRKDGFILGEGHLVSGFEEELVGLKAGEEKNFSLTFPEDFPRVELRGKKVDFKVKVNTVQRIELPEITDEWAQSLGKFEDLDSLKKSIKEGILLEKEQAESQRLRREILEKIVQATEVQLPEILIKREKEQILANIKEGVNKTLQISFQDYLRQIKKTQEELEASLKGEAEKRVKEFLVLREIEKRENIKAEEEEVKEEINKILRHYFDPKKAEKELDPEKLKLYAERIVKNEKIFQTLESLAGKQR